MFRLLVSLLVPMALLVACAHDGEARPDRSVSRVDVAGHTADSSVAPLEKSPDEWRALLSADAFNVMFEEGTEAPGSSPLLHEKREGTFICAACNYPLFQSDAKFESGTGWPSFFRPIEGHLGTKADHKLFMERTEYHCARCGAHQGHVFNDGPEPTGLRYCNNGVALRFVPKGEEMPALRQ